MIDFSNVLESEAGEHAHGGVFQQVDLNNNQDQFRRNGGAAQKVEIDEVIVFDMKVNGDQGSQKKKTKAGPKKQNSFVPTRGHDSIIKKGRGNDLYSFKVRADIEMSDLGNTNSISVHNLS